VSHDPNERLRLCTFQIGAELFAIDIMRIREIVRPLPVTPVPKAPFGMEGLINLRGEVLPLIDLRARFDLEPRAQLELPRGRFLITRIGPRQLGLAVDDVHDVVEVRRADMRVGQGVLSGRAGELFVGVCPIGDRLGMLLNLHRLLSSEDRVAIDSLTETAPGVET
jgi:purine-binding chemotaxis protein CheW